MVKMFKNIYKDKKVLLTGHTGFKGAWMTLWLNSLGADVVGYSLDYPSEPSLSQLLSQKVTNIVGDIRDYNHLVSTLKIHKPDIIFHFAAQALVRKSYQNPLETYQTNIIGVANLLEAVRNTGDTKAIVNVTTDKCYENMNKTYAYKESDPLGGYDPYSSSKACSEIITSSYRRSYLREMGILVATARAGNVIGGGDWAKERLIPDIILATSKHKSAIIRNPRSIRPWQYVLEPLSGYLQLGQKLLEGDVSVSTGWNFGPSDSLIYTVEDVVTMMKEHWSDIDPDFSASSLQDFHEANQLQLDCSKAGRVMGWKPVWDLHRSLRMTVDWYKSFYTKNVS